jgi:hypothetical protein
MNKGRIDTRVYENMVKSYANRLLGVRQELAFIDAQDELNKVSGFWRSILGGKK